MYVELLTRALNDWADEANDVDLVEHTLACRASMLHSSWHRASAYGALAAEVSYDRSLIKLAAANHVEASPAAFAQPAAARRRLEQALALRGINVTALARVAPG